MVWLMVWVMGASPDHVSTGSATKPSQLDFSNLQSVILLRSNSTISFINLTLTNVAPPLIVDPATYPYPAARFLWAWPSLVAEAGASVSHVTFQSVVALCESVDTRTIGSQH